MQARNQSGPVTDRILSFRDRHFFLSNFYPQPITYHNLTYPTSEHAYQAEKTDVQTMREEIRLAATPGQAKRIGQKAILRPNWEQMRLRVMEDILRVKFAPDTSCAHLLVMTYPKDLIEGNYWGDRYWGMVQNGKTYLWEGENNLGKILMRIREDLRRKAIHEQQCTQ